MKCSCLNVGRAEVCQATAHFTGCALCEGHGENIRPGIDPLANPMGDAVGYGSGFPSSSTRNDHQRAAQVLGRAALFRIECID